MALAAGGGVLHEPGGTNVLLARLVARRSTDSWRLHGNLLFQKPLSSERDAVDLITSVGWARNVTPAVSLGVEAIGEDLEGFWESNETEGGARLLAGPRLHLACRTAMAADCDRRPVIPSVRHGALERSVRDLPPDTKRASYAFKASLSIALFSAR